MSLLIFFNSNFSLRLVILNILVRDQIMLSIIVFILLSIIEKNEVLNFSRFEDAQLFEFNNNFSQGCLCCKWITTFLYRRFKPNMSAWCCKWKQKINTHNKLFNSDLLPPFNLISNRQYATTNSNQSINKI